MRPKQAGSLRYSRDPSPSLADTEGLKEVIEHTLVVDFTGNLTQRIERPAQVAGQQLDRTRIRNLLTCNNQT